MQRTFASLVRTFAWTYVSFVAVTGQAAEPVRLSVADGKPPQELAEPIRAALQPSVVRLIEKDDPFFELWLRKEVPLAEKPSADGLSPTTLKEGTLLGGLKLNSLRRDFKDLDIPPGVYVLRFGIQPEDGNHLGVSPTRTFALLIPADKDRDVESFSGHDPVVKASSEITAGEHPIALNLQPVRGAEAKFPSLAVHEDGNFKVLYLRLPGKLDEQTAPIPLAVAVVYEGKGKT